MPKLSLPSGIRWLITLLPAGFAAWLLILWTGGAFVGHRNTYRGGLHWQAASMNLWESFHLRGHVLRPSRHLQQKFNRQGRLSKFLSRNAFSVYVFHPPILIMAARMLHGWLWPPMLKFVILTCLAVAVSFALSEAVFGESLCFAASCKGLPCKAFWEIVVHQAP